MSADEKNTWPVPLAVVFLAGVAVIGSALTGALAALIVHAFRVTLAAMGGP